MLYLVSDELTSIDRELMEPKPKAEDPVRPGEFVIGLKKLRIKDVTWRNARDYKCAFCKKNNPGKNAKCQYCNAHLIQFGNLDFMYKTRDGSRLGTGEAEELRQLYVKQQHDAARQQQ